MFKYKLGQRLFFMDNNRVTSREVTCRMIVENEAENRACTEEQKQSWATFGPAQIAYSFCGQVLTEDQVFATKEEVIASL